MSHKVPVKPVLIVENLKPTKRVFFKSKANGQVITVTEPNEKACMGDYVAGEKQLFDVVQSASKLVIFYTVY